MLGTLKPSRNCHHFGRRYQLKSSCQRYEYKILLLSRTNQQTRPLLDTEDINAKTTFTAFQHSSQSSFSTLCWPNLSRVMKWNSSITTYIWHWTCDITTFHSPYYRYCPLEKVTYSSILVLLFINKNSFFLEWFTGPSRIVIIQNTMPSLAWHSVVI